MLNLSYICIVLRISKFVLTYPSLYVEQLSYLAEIYIFVLKKLIILNSCKLCHFLVFLQGQKIINLGDLSLLFPLALLLQVLEFKGLSKRLDSFGFL